MIDTTTIATRWCGVQVKGAPCSRGSRRLSNGSAPREFEISARRVLQELAAVAYANADDLPQAQGDSTGRRRLSGHRQAATVPEAVSFGIGKT